MSIASPVLARSGMNQGSRGTTYTASGPSACDFARLGMESMAGDKYRNFEELRGSEREGADFRIRVLRRTMAVGTLAPHGGKIEPGTSRIAEAIAGDDYSLYCFEGLRRQGNSDLHIRSVNFTEPRCLDLISNCALVVSVHGIDDTNSHVEVGGLDSTLRDLINRHLQTAGFSAESVARGNRAGRDPSNICNRGASGRGVQLEVTRGMRDQLVANAAELRRFADAVRAGIEDGRNSK
jgi:phage replication-related protein YjqB (UPF0714/DUF867 family)